MSLFSPLPLNDGSAEAKGSCCETVTGLLLPAEFGFIIRGLYIRAGSLPVCFFFFPKAAKNRIVAFVVRGEKEQEILQTVIKKKAELVHFGISRP